METPSFSPRYSPTLPRPTERAIRPTSASAKLQSHPSYYTRIVESAKKRTDSALSHLSSRPRRAVLGAEVRIEEEDYKSEKNLRRSTVTGTERHAAKYKIDLLSETITAGEDGFKTKVEDYITIDILRKLLTAFLKNRQSRYEEGRLTKDEFSEILKEHLANTGVKTQHIVGFFEKIDWPNYGKIGWSDFCTYMQLQYSQREELYVKDHAVHLAIPAKSKITPHRDDVIKCIDIGDNVFLSCGKDGYVCFWSATSLDLRRHKDLMSSPDMNLKKSRTRSKWATDVCVLTDYNKVCIATGDREFLFYELSSLAPYCQLAKLPGIPISMCFSSRSQAGSRKNDIGKADEGIFIFGDTNGQVHVMSLANPGEFLRNWKKAKPIEAGGLPTASFDEVYCSPSCRYVCWMVHNDWTHTVFYWQELDQIVSASNDSQNSFVIGCVFPLTNVQGLRDMGSKKFGLSQSLHPMPRPYEQQTVFKVHKGIKTLAISVRFSCLVTGGMDRVIRIWNPFSPSQPTATLRGHAAPIISLYVDDAEARIFSFSQEKGVRVWSLLDHGCLLSIKTKSHKIVGDLQVAFYSPISKVIAMATDRMSVIPVMTRAAVHVEIVSTHREPVTCCLYNPVFNHVVSCSEGSVIRVWDLDTGGLVFEFGEAHGESGITSAQFDVTWRRLVTGGRDGVARIWNYNNGHRLKTLLSAKKQRRPATTVHRSSIPSTGFASRRTPGGSVKSTPEVCGVCYVELNNNRYVYSVGWERRINIFLDNIGGDAEMEEQTPSYRWDDDLDRGHHDDILCMAQCPPNWLATGGFDGQLIIWNMVSGHQLANLEAPTPDISTAAHPASMSSDQSFDNQILDNAHDNEYNSRFRRTDTCFSARSTICSSRSTAVVEKVQVDTAIRKVIFLPRRAAQRLPEGAQLIAAGPNGCLHFWNLIHGGKLLARISGSAVMDGIVTALGLDDKEEFLFTGDSHGFIYKWYIDDYARGAEFVPEPPDLRCFFRCHVEAISAVNYVAKHEVLITSSLDCTVRMWDLVGGYIGTFGQQDLWDIRNPATFRRPHVPYDVLIDPLSLPGPSGAFEATATDQKDHVTLVEVLAEMKAEQKKVDEVNREIWSVRSSHKISSDAQIEEALKTRIYSAGTGKRLRHERQKIERRVWLGPSHYQSLRTFTLDEGPAQTAQQAEQTKREIARHVPVSGFDD